MEHRRNDQNDRLDARISDQLLWPPVHGHGSALRNIQSLLRMLPADRAQSGIRQILYDVAGIAAHLLGRKRHQRRPEEPNVPTLAELGIRGVEHNVWAAVYLPEKTPDEIVTRLNDEFVRAARAPEVVKRLTAEGFLIRTGSPEDLRRFQASEIETLRSAVRKVGIKPE